MAVPVHGLLPCLCEGLRVVPVPPALKGPREFVVSRCDEGETGQRVSFAGITDIDGASDLVGKTLLVREEDVPEGAYEEELEELIGLEVVDVRRGTIGTITEVLVGDYQDVWVCDGPYGEVMVPGVEELVVDFPEDGPIVVDLPNGLVPEGE